MSKAAEPRLATIRRAADYADCSTRTIERRIADKTLTRYGKGRMIRVDLNEITAWLKPGVA